MKNIEIFKIGKKCGKNPKNAEVLDKLETTLKRWKKKSI